MAAQPADLSALLAELMDLHNDGNDRVSPRRGGRSSDGVTAARIEELKRRIVACIPADVAADDYSPRTGRRHAVRATPEPPPAPPRGQRFVSTPRRELLSAAELSPVSLAGVGERIPHCKTFGKRVAPGGIPLPLPPPQTPRAYSKRMHIERQARVRHQEEAHGRLPEQDSVFSPRNRHIVSGELSMETRRPGTGNLNGVATLPAKLPPQPSPRAAVPLPPSAAADHYRSEYARSTSLPAATRPVTRPDAPTHGAFFHPAPATGRVREVRTFDNGILELSPRVPVPAGAAPFRGMLQTLRTGV